VIVLDTTILVYAVGTEHPLRRPARQRIEWVRAGNVRATTTIEVLQEFAHFRSRRRPRAEAAIRAREYALGLSPLVYPDQGDLLEGLARFGDSEGLGPFDAVLAVTARRRGWALASADHSLFELAGKNGGLVLFDISDHDVYAPCLTTVCPETEAAPETLWEYAGYKK
jgi:predicted nucleic acid-binding protein